jgi:hypothetical protein
MTDQTNIDYDAGRRGFIVSMPPARDPDRPGRPEARLIAVPTSALTRPLPRPHATPTPRPPPAELFERRVISLFPPHADGPAFGFSKGGRGWTLV